LTPVLEVLSDKIPLVKIGKVDATKNKRIATTFNITKFPTIKYHKEGVWGDYEGLRSLADFEEFVARMSKPSVRSLSTIADIDHLEVSFLLSVGSDSEKSQVRASIEAFDSVSKAMQSKAHFGIVEHKGAVTKVSRIWSVHSPTRIIRDFEHDLGQGSVTSTDITNFVNRYNRPLFAQFDNSNFKRLGGLELPLVIAVLDYRQPSSRALQAQVHASIMNQ